MTDKFIAAVQELGEAIEAGEHVRPALAEIAKEHGLDPAALRRRAERALGELGTYRRRKAKAAATIVPGNTEEERRLWVKARKILLARAKEAGMRTTVEEIDLRLLKCGVEWALNAKVRFEPTPATFNDVPRPAWIKE